MFTAVTYQDWEATPETKRVGLLEKIIQQYKASAEFKNALLANRYDRSDNAAIAEKMLLKPVAIDVQDSQVPGFVSKKTSMKEVEGNRLRSSFLRRLTIQQSQFLLGNGVTLENAQTKAKLGPGFDTALSQMGRRALLHGVCWGFWNYDHIEILEAAKDELSGFVTLLDEETSTPMIGVHFWQLSENRPLWVRLFETEGVSVYRRGKGDKKLVLYRPRRGYVQTRTMDVRGVVDEQYANYGVLPIVPFLGNEDKCSELTLAIKTKIDAYDRIFSDFGDNLDRANDVYWVLNNFGGSKSEIACMLQEINELKAVLNQSDGTGAGSTAEAKTIDVPYAARQTALDLLRSAIYEDYMGLDKREFSGSSLTNVGIQASTIDLNLKADGLEWGAFAFVQGVLRLLKVQTEKIVFKRREIVNKSEIVTDIYTMREDLDDETALKLNPYIEQDEIDDILNKLNARRMTGYSDADYADDAARKVQDGQSGA